MYSTLRLAAIVAISLPVVGCFDPGVTEADRPARTQSIEFDKELQSNASGPRLRIEPPVIELTAAEVADGAIVTKRFRLINDGSAPLHVMSIGRSCSCTNIEFESAPIAAGHGADLDVHIRPTPARDDRAVLTLNSNDPSRPQQQCEIRWQGQLQLRIQPSRLDLGRINHKTPSRWPVHLRGRGGVELTAQQVKTISWQAISRDPDLEVTIEPSSGVADVELILRSTNAPKDVSSGFITIYVHDGENQAVADATYDYQRVPPIRVEPSVVSLTTHPGAVSNVPLRVLFDGPETPSVDLTAEPATFLGDWTIDGKTEPAPIDELSTSKRSVLIESTMIAPSSLGLHQGTMKASVRLADQKDVVVVIPVSFLVLAGSGP